MVKWTTTFTDILFKRKQKRLRYLWYGYSGPDFSEVKSISQATYNGYILKNMETSAQLLTKFHEKILSYSVITIISMVQLYETKYSRLDQVKFVGDSHV